MAATLDFSQPGKTGHEQSFFGQQPCHCRLINRFILDFKRDSSLQASFPWFFTSVKLKMMASSSITWMTTLRKRYALIY